MATTKTLTPTNQTITIAAFQGEKPDHRQVADAESKLSDAVNTLNSQMAKQVKYYTYEYTIAANSSLSITANDMGMDSPPSGYTPVAIAYFNTANVNVLARGVNATETNGSSNCIWLQNMSNSQQTGTMNVAILYLKF